MSLTLQIAGGIVLAKVAEAVIIGLLSIPAEREKKARVKKLEAEMVQAAEGSQKHLDSPEHKQFVADLHKSSKPPTRRRTATPKVVAKKTTVRKSVKKVGPAVNKATPRKAAQKGGKK